MSAELQRPRALPAFVLGLMSRGLRASGRLLVLLVAARAFGVAEVAHLAYLLAVGSFVALVADGGFSVLLSRELAARGDAAAPLQRRLVRVRLLTFPLVLAASWGLARLGDPLVRPADAGALAFALALGLSDLSAAICRGQSWFRREVLELGAPLGGAAMGATAAVVLGLPFDGFSGLVGAGALATALVALVLHGRGAAERGGVGAWRLALDARWLLVANLASWALFEGPLLWVKALGSEADVARLAAALRPIGFVTQPMMALGLMYLPAIAVAARTGPAELAELAGRLNRLVGALVPTALAAALLLGGGLLAAFGAEYRAAEWLLTVLALGAVLHMGPPGSWILTALGDERRLSVVALGAVCLMSAASLVLVPRWGALGAALAQATALAALKAVHLLLHAARRLPLEPLRLGLTWAAGGALAASSWWLAGPARWLVFVAAFVLGLGLFWRQLAASRLYVRGPGEPLTRP